MDEQLERAIVNLRGALRAAAWADPTQTEALVREARDACNDWLAPDLKGRAAVPFAALGRN
jgi:hypothetical protein